MADEIQQIVNDYVARKTGKVGRKRLIGLPPEQVVPPLANALRATRNSYEYTRLANVLADIGDDTAFTVLREQAISRATYPRVATLALARCRHVEVEPTLIDIMLRGRNKQKHGAALAMARTRILRSITLCAESLAQGSPAGPLLIGALRELGNRHTLAHQVLSAPAASSGDRLRTLTFVMGLPLGFTFRRFDLDRFLEREAEREGSVNQAVARELLQLRLDQKTLLRPAEAVSPTTLLRPASTPPVTPSDLLLHASSEPEGDEEEEEEEGVWRRICQRLRRGF